MNHHLPFKVGQQAESKSFLPGFRGAWFRCNIKSRRFKGSFCGLVWRGKIRFIWSSGGIYADRFWKGAWRSEDFLKSCYGVKDIRWKKDQAILHLEYFDFPDEKNRWTKLYQKHPGRRNAQEEQLMVRPCFPHLCQENQKPDAHSISEVVVVANDTWRVGDLVDWWSDDCYWSGTVILLLGKDKVKIALLEPPLGEGQTYEAFCKDLRPSLDWSPEYGWTVPISGDKETSHHCATLVHPSAKNHDHLQGAVFQNQDRSEMPSVESSPSAKKFYQINKEDKNRRSHTRTESDREDTVIGKANCIDTDSNSHNKEKYVSSPVKKVSSLKDRDNLTAPAKKMRTGDGGHTTSMMFSDTIDSSVMGLEELANKIKWLKGVLQYGLRRSDAMMKPSWKFMGT